MSAPARPGPDVTATASRSRSPTPAVRQARSIVGTIASRCARLATSGTTPPKRACSSTLLAISSARSVSPRTMPTPVSSHEVSMPSTSGASGDTRAPWQQLAHHERIDVPGLVVPVTGREHLVAAVLVECAGCGVVGAYLQKQGCRVPRAGAALQLGEEQPPDPEASGPPRDADRHEVGDVTAVVEPGIPHHALSVVHHDVVPPRTPGELSPPGLLGPRVIREELELEGREGRDVGPPRLAHDPGHHPGGAAHRPAPRSAVVSASGRRR